MDEIRRSLSYPSNQWAYYVRRSEPNRAGPWRYLYLSVTSRQWVPNGDYEAIQFNSAEEAEEALKAKLLEEARERLLDMRRQRLREEQVEAFKARRLNT